MDARETARQMAQSCLLVRLRAINRAITRLYDSVLRSYGLRSTQMSLLVAVVGYGPVRPADLAAVLELEKSTLSRDIGRLAARGVTTAPHEDGRSHYLVATVAGQELLAHISEAWEEAQKRAEQVLGAEGTAALLRLGDRFFQIPEGATTKE